MYRFCPRDYFASFGVKNNAPLRNNGNSSVRATVLFYFNLVVVWLNIEIMFHLAREP
jgi:hypothetical protein